MYLKTLERLKDITVPIIYLSVLGAISFSYGISTNLGVNLITTFSTEDYVKIGVLWLPTALFLGYILLAYYVIFYILAGICLYSMRIFILFLSFKFSFFYKKSIRNNDEKSAFTRFFALPRLRHASLFSCLMVLIIVYYLLSDNLLSENHFISNDSKWIYGGSIIILPFMALITYYQYFPLKEGDNKNIFLSALIVSNIFSAFIFGFNYETIINNITPKGTTSVTQLNDNTSTINVSTIITLSSSTISRGVDDNKIYVIPSSSIKYTTFNN